jgi:glycosyltransferase involved in cell wall biosynthesis
VVGFLGRQAASKGVDTLVRAMETVWRSVPGAQLLIAGGRTAFSEVLRGMVAALPERLRRQVLFVEGFSHEEKPDLFAACDVFVNASRDESFGIVFLEAWASGTPVIGARTGAVSCVVEEGRDGLLVPYGSADSLAAAIVRVLGDDRLRATLAENGRAKVWNDHTWDGVVERLRAVYEHALDPSRAGGVRPSRGWGQASITSAS